MDSPGVIAERFDEVTILFAARMESHGVPDQIQLAKSSAELLGESYRLASRGVIEVKGKGPLETWLLTGPKADAS